jgi:5-methylcytosine-specific restriction enzyme A
MSPVPATVPADAVLRTINPQDDYSFFLLLVGVHHSTIRPTDLRLSASKSVAPQKVRTVGRAGRPMTSNWDRYPSKSSVRCSTAEWQRIRAKVLQRDERQCQIRLPGCLIDGDQCDHAVPVSHGGTDDVDNLRCACDPCHKKLTAQQAQAGRAHNRRKRKPRPHPADLVAKPINAADFAKADPTSRNAAPAPAFPTTRYAHPAPTPHQSAPRRPQRRRSPDRSTQHHITPTATRTPQTPHPGRLLGVVATLLVNWLAVDHANARLGYPSRAFCVAGR